MKKQEEVLIQKYPLDYGETKRLLDGLFEMAIETRDSAQAMSGRILDLQRELTQKQVDYLKSQAKG